MQDRGELPHQATLEFEFAIQYCEQLAVPGAPETLPLDTGDHMIGEDAIGE